MICMLCYDILLLADVFKNFRNTFLEIYKIYPAKLCPRPGLELQQSFKNTKLKLDILADINILLMVEKVLVEAFVMVEIYLYEKANNKYMKDYHKYKQLLYIQYWEYWDVNNLCLGNVAKPSSK